jgi:transposase-like protein
LAAIEGEVVHMFKPTLRQLETVADMSWGGMSPQRIASALGIPAEVFTAWVSRLSAARALDPQAADLLLYPPRPVAVQPQQPPRDPRILAERMFAQAE